MRIAVAGFGFMGQQHAASWQRIPGVELAAVVAPEGVREVHGNLSTKAGPDLSNIRIAERLDAVLADASIAAIDLCVPTSLHHALAVDCLQAGKHVLVEKPMALSGEECDAMIAAARATGRILMVAHVLRFWPEYQPLLEAARSGSLGRLISLDLRRQCAAPSWNDWIRDANRSGGGVFDLLIHDVDMCLAVAGIPEAISASGEGDWMAAQLRYGDIASVTISGGWSPAPQYPFSMSYRAEFEAGTIEFTSGSKPPTLYRNEGGEESLAGSTVDAFDAELSYFSECIATGHHAERCRMEDSAIAVRLTRALADARAHRGGKRGEWIEWL